MERGCHKSGLREVAAPGAPACSCGARVHGHTVHARGRLDHGLQTHQQPWRGSYHPPSTCTRDNTLTLKRKHSSTGQPSTACAPLLPGSSPPPDLARGPDAELPPALLLRRRQLHLGFAFGPLSGLDRWPAKQREACKGKKSLFSGQVGRCLVLQKSPVGPAPGHDAWQASAKQSNKASKQGV